MSHKRRRRRRTAEAVWLTGKWQNESRVSHSLDPLLTPHLSWRSWSQDQGVGLPFWYLPCSQSQQPLGHFPAISFFGLKLLFWTHSNPTCVCFVEHESLDRDYEDADKFWLNITPDQVLFFLAAGIYCKYISLNTSYLLTVSFVPAIRERGGHR